MVLWYISRTRTNVIVSLLDLVCFEKIFPIWFREQKVSEQKTRVNINYYTYCNQYIPLHIYNILYPSPSSIVSTCIVPNKCVLSYNY